MTRFVKKNCSECGNEGQIPAVFANTELVCQSCSDSVKKKECWRVAKELNITTENVYTWLCRDYSPTLAFSLARKISGSDNAWRSYVWDYLEARINNCLEELVKDGRVFKPADHTFQAYSPADIVKIRLESR